MPKEKEKKEKKSKSSKSSKSKDKSEVDKKSSKSKSEKESKKSKSGKSSKSATPSKDKKSSRDKSADGKSQKSKKSSKSKASKSPSNIDIASQLNKSELDGEMMRGGQTMQPNYGGMDPLIGGDQSAGYATISPGGMASTSPFGRQGMLNPHVAQSKTCMLHNKPLRYFCETCEELLCYDCTVMGPHNTQLHRICNLEEAFRYRFESINKSIH